MTKHRLLNITQFYSCVMFVMERERERKRERERERERERDSKALTIKKVGA